MSLKIVQHTVGIHVPTVLNEYKSSMYQRKKSVFLTEDIQLSSESRSTGTPAEDDGGALVL